MEVAGSESGLDPVLGLGSHSVAAIGGLGIALDHGDGLSGLSGSVHSIPEVSLDLVDGLHCYMPFVVTDIGSRR